MFLILLQRCLSTLYRVSYRGGVEISPPPPPPPRNTQSCYYCINRYRRGIATGKMYSEVRPSLTRLLLPITLKLGVIGYILGVA